MAFWFFSLFAIDFTQPLYCCPHWGSLSIYFSLPGLLSPKGVCVKRQVMVSENGSQRLKKPLSKVLNNLAHSGPFVDRSLTLKSEKWQNLTPFFCARSPKSILMGERSYWSSGKELVNPQAFPPGSELPHLHENDELTWTDELLTVYANYRTAGLCYSSMAGIAFAICIAAQLKSFTGSSDTQCSNFIQQSSNKGILKVLFVNNNTL